MTDDKRSAQPSPDATQPIGGELKRGAVDFDLRGKDWLTEAEAAHYCGVSLRQFQERGRQFNARRFMGKKLYSRNELFDSIQRAPLWRTTRTTYVPPEHLYQGLDPNIVARLSGERIRPYKPRKKL